MRKVKAARKAPTCYGGGTEEDEHGWEYLCEWEGEQSDSWVWHDKMPHTWERELMHAQGARRQAASLGASSLLWEQLTQSRRGSRVDSSRQKPREAWEYLASLG